MKCIRSFGLLLKIEGSKLDRFEQDPVNTVKLIVTEWFKTPMPVSERWEELGRVLLAPAVQEWRIARDLQQQLRRGSSIDSAITEMSDASRSSISSPTEVFPPLQMSNIGMYSKYCPVWLKMHSALPHAVLALFDPSLAPYY